MTVPLARETSTVLTAPGGFAPTSFVIDVAGTGGTATLVTVDVATTTTVNGAGATSTSLAGILSGDQVQVSGAQDGLGMVDATSVTLSTGTAPSPTTTGEQNGWGASAVIVMAMGAPARA